MAKNQKKSYISKLKVRYRLIVYNDNTYKEVGFIRLTPFNILSILGLLVVLFITSIYLLLAYTPLRELIPGYPDSNFRRQIIVNALRIDSLQHEIEIRNRYYNNLNNIIAGNEPMNYSNKTKDSVRVKNVQFSKSIKDSILRKQIEEEEQFNLTVRQVEKKYETIDFSRMHFFTPISGIVTNAFNSQNGHYGVDIVAEANSVIKSALDGTVILATWTLETGYVIQIQHENNFVSVYKHNSELLKKEGNRVIAGEVIAIIGNTGELTTGPHLHFELWQNGKPVNPQEYIVF